MENTNTNAQKIAMEIISLFTFMKGANFIGVTYRNAYGELSKSVLIADFKYGIAVAKSIDILNSLTASDFLKIAEKYNVCNVAGIQYSNNAKGKEYLASGKLPKEGTKARIEVLESIKTTKTLATICAEMVQSYIDNANKETRSASSEAQIEAYEKVTNSIKVCKATNNVHIFALAHSREVIEAGTYPESEKLPETIQKDAIISYCKYVLGMELPTTKYRNLKVTADNLCRVKALGSELFCE